VLPLRIRIPPKRIRERFKIVYELEGAQRAVDYLCKFYKVRRMRVILDGKRVGARKSNGWLACYSEGKAFFTKSGLNRKNILHEFYHFLVDMNGLEMSAREEEKEANNYAKRLLSPLSAQSTSRK
jgi:hypothetical protein